VTPAARTSISALIAVVAMSLACATAVAAPEPEQGFGLNVQSLVQKPQPFSVNQWPAYLGLMARDGLHTARADALWPRVEPKPPDRAGRHYDWSTTDALAAALAAAGLRWDAVLGGSPGWARAGTANLYAAPRRDHYADFAAYAGAFVARYGVDGTFWKRRPDLPSLPVRLVEILNEPNLERAWGSAPDPAAYADIYTRARNAVKAASPSTQVAVGGLIWNDDAAYLRGMLAALGLSAVIDAVGYHPYGPTFLSVAANVQRVRKVLDDAGQTAVPLLINEVGWPAAYDRAPSAHAVNGPVADVSRAGTLALTVDALARSTCNVGNIMIYDLVEGEQDPSHVESLMGVYRRDGSSTATSAALRDAVARYRAGGEPAVPVPLCGARGAAATRLLPLELTAQAVAPSGCRGVRVTYRGLPIEEAHVQVVGPRGTTTPTDADGRADACRPTGAAPSRLVADVPGAAGSNALVCGADCRTVGPGAACLLARVSPRYGAKPAAVARRGLRIPVTGCDPQQGGTVELSWRLVARDRQARALGLTKRSRATIAIGRGRAIVAPGGGATLTARFPAAARRRLARARRVVLRLEVTAVEAGTWDARTSVVVLRR
jgi:hypothetical protein